MLPVSLAKRGMRIYAGRAPCEDEGRNQNNDFIIQELDLRGGGEVADWFSEILRGNQFLWYHELKYLSITVRQ